MWKKSPYNDDMLSQFHLLRWSTDCNLIRSNKEDTLKGFKQIFGRESAASSSSNQINSCAIELPLLSWIVSKSVMGTVGRWHFFSFLAGDISFNAHRNRMGRYSAVDRRWHGLPDSGFLPHFWTLPVLVCPRLHQHWQVSNPDRSIDINLAEKI